MSPPTPRQSRAVSINGPALRAIRQLLNVDVADIVAALDCHESTISKLETGANRRASPRMVSALCEVLGIVDRRVLLACPYGEESHEENAPTHDEVADTAELERPEVGGEVPRVVATPRPGTVRPATPGIPGAVVPAPRASSRRGAKHRAGVGR